MGWSCNEAANKRLHKILEENNDIMHNMWTTAKGRRCFFELSPTTHPDGSITGSVMKFVTVNQTASVVRAGSVKIEGNGNVTRFPLLNKEMRIASKIPLI